MVASRGHFPATLGGAVRQKARWLGGIALAGWDRLGWSGGIGERWMRLRDRRGPLAALLLLAAYSAAFLWSQLFLAQRSVRRSSRFDPACRAAHRQWLALAWRILMRAGFTTYAYGFGRRFAVDPRLVVGNVIAILAAARAISIHVGGGAQALGQDPARLSRGAAAVRPSLRFLGLALLGWAGLRAATLGALPGAEIFRIDPSEAKPPPIVPTQFPPIEPVEPESRPRSGGQHASGRLTSGADATYAPCGAANRPSAGLFTHRAPYPGSPPATRSQMRSRNRGGNFSCRIRHSTDGP